MMIEFNGKRIETAAATLAELLVEQGVVQKGDTSVRSLIDSV